MDSLLPENTPPPNPNQSRVRLYLTIGGVAIVLLLALYILPGTRRFLTTQVVQVEDAQEGETQIANGIVVKPDGSLTPGTYNTQLEVYSGDQMLARSNNFEITINDGTGGGDNDNPGGGGGDDDSDGGEDDGDEGRTTSEEHRTIVFHPKDHTRVNKVGDENIAGLQAVGIYDNKSSIAKRNIRVPRDNYYLYFLANSSQPAPVKMSIRVGGQTWKAFDIKQNDNKWRLYNAGVLRNFDGGTISFHFRNDRYESDKNIDRNLYLGAVNGWALSTDPNLTKIPGVTPQAGQCLRSRGWALVPRINEVLRSVSEEAGINPRTVVTSDAWRYWATRLTAESCKSYNISSEPDLRAKARFWLGVNRGTAIYPVD